MKINNDSYGGFIVSKNILKGIPVRFTFREESSISQLNGWTLYSAADDDEYVADPSNFEVVSATTLFDYAPKMDELFDAPYGTDVCWLYDENGFTGFYDMEKDRETTLEEILKGEISKKKLGHIYLGFLCWEIVHILFKCPKKQE